MKRDSTNPPYLSWCLCVRNSATKKMIDGHTFERTLQLLRERTPDAEIVVVDTCSRDETPEIAQRYADVFTVYRGPDGSWDADMLAVPDMTKAREHAFALASGTWLGWVDDDDALPDREESVRLLRGNKRLGTAEGEVHGKPEDIVELEDLLRRVETEFPQVDWIWCPYQYRSDENDHALVWQERERFVKRSAWSRFKWIEAAHDCIVPAKPGEMPKRADFSHLLFVHKTDFSAQENVTYATERHYRVLLEQPRTTRRCIYLAAYAATLEPKREAEFVEEAMRCAITAIDRYRARLLAGNFARKRGLFLEAAEHYGAATNLVPDLPDAWFRGAEMYIAQKNPAKAIQWLERGLITPQGHGASEISPWLHEIRYPTILALELEKLGKAQMEAGAHEVAEATLGKAAQLALGVCKSDAVVGDETEAKERFRRLNNQFFAQKTMREMHGHFQHLLKNDESQKAAKLAESIPHLCEDHPLAVEIERFAREVKAHEESPEKLYKTDAFGPVPTPEKNYDDPNYLEGERAKEIATWVKTKARESGAVTILDFGCYDGIVGIPVLEACQGDVKRYIGVDADPRALERLRRVAYERDLEDVIDTYEAKDFWPDKIDAPVDLVVFTEIIEHVPDPAESISNFHLFSDQDTALFISTPWGSFDHGNPPEQTLCGTDRSHLGHLRAMTPRDVVQALDDADWRPIDLRRVGKQTARENIHVWALPGNRGFRDEVAFAVRGALWDWNGRTLHQRGMGYSESAIVYLAERLTKDGKSAEVYGPVPEETVYAGVPYWKRAKLRHLDESTKVVVSRAPAYCREIDEATKPIKTSKVLWLQDTHYPEFDHDPSLVNEYEWIVAVSNWHRDLLISTHNGLTAASQMGFEDSGIPYEKVKVIPNWIPPGLYERDPADWPERDPGYMIYASSPDRGLIHLLRLWPRIRRILPSAKLDIFYGWEGCITLGSSASDAWLHRFETTRREYDKLRWQEGIREVGMRPQGVIAEALYNSGVWCYPTNFCETFGTIGAQARAAGVVPVCTALAGLNESAACEQAVLVDPEADDWEDRFLDGIERAVATPKEARVEMAREALRQYGIDAVMPLWEEVLR